MGMESKNKRKYYCYAHSFSTIEYVVLDFEFVVLRRYSKRQHEELYCDSKRLLKWSHTKLGLQVLRKRFIKQVLHSIVKSLSVLQLIRYIQQRFMVWRHKSLKKTYCLHR